MRLISCVPVLLLCAACLPALDIVTVSAVNSVSPESSGSTSPLRFRIERTGATGIQDVSLSLSGAAILGTDFNIVGSRGGLAVSAIRILDGGDYSSVPAVTIARAPGDSTGAGATATAVLGLSSFVSVNDGGAYSEEPGLTVASGAASISPLMSLVDVRAEDKDTSVPDGVYGDVVGTNPVDGGRPARGTVTVASGIATFTSTDAGSGYAIGESVTFSFGDGTTSDSITGIALYQITGIRVNSPGRDYTSVPSITVTAFPGTEFDVASLTATLELVAVDIISGGMGYTIPPIVTIAPGNEQASAISSGFDTTIRILDGQRDAVLTALPISDDDIELAESVKVAVLTGVGYITSNPRQAEGTIADDDIRTSWLVGDAKAEEDLDGRPPLEATMTVGFAGNPASTTGGASDFTREVDVQPLEEGAALSEDYLVTIMVRHPGQPVGKTMLELRTTNYDFTAGWRTPQSENLDVGVTRIPYIPAMGFLSPGDIIQFGDDSVYSYRVVSVGGARITISPGLQSAVSGGTLIRNNLSINIASDGDVQGINLPPGYTSIDYTITPLYDSLPEGAEVASWRLLGSNDYQLGDPQLNDVIIGDDDVRVNFVLDGNAGEPASNGSVLVTLSAPLNRDMIVLYDISGTAVPGVDYDTLPGSITVPAGQTSVRIPIVPRLDADSDVEFVTLTLKDSEDYKPAGTSSGGSNPSATVNILDSAGTVNIAVQDGIAVESETDAGANPGSFRIRIDGPRNPGSPAVSVLYTVSGSAISGADFTPFPGRVTIPSGQQFVDVTLNVIDDVIVEGRETVTLTLQSAAGYGVSATGSTATIQIQDDEPMMRVSPIASMAEPTGASRVVIGYTGTPLNRSFQVPYLLTGTAIAGSDYAGLSGTASIPAGQLTTEVTVSVIDDIIAEVSETVVLTLQPSDEYSLDSSGSVASFDIRDDEPVVSVSQIAAGLESGAPTQFRIGLDRLMPRDLVVGYVINGGSAQAGIDYVVPYAGAQGTVTVTAGQMATTLDVLPINDLAVEGDESFIITLQSSNLYSLLSASTAVIGLIRDDEPTINIVATVANAAEPAQPGQFTVQNTGSTRNIPLLVSYLVGGTATSGSDFLALSGTVVIPANQSQAVIPLSVIDDAVVESAESVIITLLASTDGSYGLGATSSATVTITDDDTPVTPGKPPTGSSSGGSGGCGLGSGLAALLGALALTLRLGLRRRR